MSASQEDHVVGHGAVIPSWFQALMMRLALGIIYGHCCGLKVVGLL